MDRKQFLDKLSGKGTESAFPPVVKLEKYTTSLTDADKKHLLKRTCFGMRPTDVGLLNNKTIDQILDLILTPDGPPSPPINTYNTASFTDPHTASLAPWHLSAFQSEANRNRHKSFKAWWVGRMMNQSISIHEKMAMFWMNHFSAPASDVSDARFLYSQYLVAHGHALGNFKTMTKAMLLDPAMLRAFGGYVSTDSAPNENLGRELQELYTIGKPTSEQDVQAAAKILTGYQIDYTNVRYVFSLNRHDKTTKQFSSFFNNATVASDGVNELDALLNIIFAKDEVALHICRKLYRYFVYWEIDQTTENDVIVPLAQIFRSNNYNITPVLRALLQSNDFFDSDNCSNMIKSPFDFIFGIIKERRIDAPNVNTVPYKAYALWYELALQAYSFGQYLAEPPSVAGWQAWHQGPWYHQYWINADTLAKRVQFMSSILSPTGFKYDNNTSAIRCDMLLQVTNSVNSSSYLNLMESLFEDITLLEFSPQLKNLLKNYLLRPGEDSNAFNALMNNALINGNTLAKADLEVRVRNLISHIMWIPEFQLH